MNFFGFFNQTNQISFFRSPPQKGLKRVLYLLVINFVNLVKVNLLFILFCLPIITIPGAIAGLTRVSMKMAEGEPFFLGAEFLNTFKKEFKKASLFFWLHLVALIVTAIAINFYIKLGNNSWLTGVPLIISGVITVFLVLVAVYTYPMVVTFDLRLKAILKNALLLSIMCWKQNLIIIISLLLASSIILLLLPFSLFLVFLIVFSLLGLLFCYSLIQPMNKYVKVLVQKI